MRIIISIIIICLLITPGFSINPEDEIVNAKGRNLNKWSMDTFTFDSTAYLTDIKGLWLMRNLDGTLVDEYDITAHDGTLTGGLAFTDRIAKGLGYSMLFNGTTDYITMGDHADFSFGDGSTDSAFSVGALIYVKAGATVQTILSKNDETTGSTKKEYALQLGSDEKITFALFDDSATGYILTTSDAALTEGYHFAIGTYSGGGTGANLNLYVDGALVASTDADVTYTAMEDTTASLIIGSAWADAAISEPFDSYISNSFLEKSELTSADVWALWKLVQGVYGL